MFSMAPSLQNSLQSLYNQYSGPQNMGVGTSGANAWNPMQPLWMQGAGLHPQFTPYQAPPYTGPALAQSSAQLPGMMSQPPMNPNIMQLLMPGGFKPGAGNPATTTPTSALLAGMSPADQQRLIASMQTGQGAQPQQAPGGPSLAYYLQPGYGQSGGM